MRCRALELTAKAGIFYGTLLGFRMREINPLFRKQSLVDSECPAGVDAIVRERHAAFHFFCEIAESHVAACYIEY